ncbi:hypothetical protein DMENIID0001_046480 [Sergentomyia squamirostris]
MRVAANADPVSYIPCEGGSRNNCKATIVVFKVDVCMCSCGWRQHVHNSINISSTQFKLLLHSQPPNQSFPTIQSTRTQTCQHPLHLQLKLQTTLQQHHSAKPPPTLNAKRPP